MTQLSELAEDERYGRFDHLQRAMPSVWESMRLHLDDDLVVVVPSISIERTTPEAAPSPGHGRRNAARPFCCCSANRASA